MVIGNKKRDGVTMESIMDPIYEYLYGTVPMKKTSDDIISYDAELNGKSLSLLLEGTISRRFKHGVEQAYHYLYNSNRKFHASLEKNLLFQYYYLLSVIHFERGDINDLKQAFGQSNTFYDPEGLDNSWKRRYQLLQIIFQCTNYEDDAIRTAIEWFVGNDNNSNKDTPKYSLSIYFGSYGVTKEQYNEAHYFLDRSMEFAETVEQKSISFSNLGALAYAMDDFEKSIEYYQAALSEVQSQNTFSTTDDLYIMLYENLKNMEIRAAARRNEHVYPDQIRLQESEFDQAKRMRNIAKRYVTDEIYDESLLGRHSFRSSNNLYEANRYYNRAERAYQLLGHVSGKKTLLEEQIKYFLIAGKTLHRNILERIALEQAILINHDKTIEGILKDKIPFKTQDEIRSFCEWLFTCGNNRRTRLGRTHCIGYMADYLTDEHVPVAFDELWGVLQEEWSFTKEFDYKRSAMKALGRLFARLQPDQKLRLINELWGIIQTEPPLVKRQAVETIGSIREWSSYPIVQLNKLIRELLTYLEGHPRNTIDYLPLLNFLIDILQLGGEEEKRDAILFLLKKWEEGDNESLRLFLYDELVPYADDGAIEKAMKEAMKQVKNELQTESKGYYSSGIYKWGEMLAYFLPLVVGTPSLFQEAQELLIRYVNTTKQPSNKRADALKAIYYILSDDAGLPLDIERLTDACYKCFDDQETWQKNDRDLFSIEDSLLTEVFKTLSLFEMTGEQAEVCVNRFLVGTLTAGTEIDENLVALTKWAQKWSARPSIYFPIISRLYMDCKNGDAWARAAAVHGLIELAGELVSDDILWQYVSHAMELCVNDPNHIVRYNLAFAVDKLKGKKLNEKQATRVTEILNILQCDISFRVRKVASGNGVLR